MCMVAIYDDMRGTFSNQLFLVQNMWLGYYFYNLDWFIWSICNNFFSMFFLVLFFLWTLDVCSSLQFVNISSKLLLFWIYLFILLWIHCNFAKTTWCGNILHLLLMKYNCCMVVYISWYKCCILARLTFLLAMLVLPSAWTISHICSTIKHCIFHTKLYLSQP
jgi:hypothetical protein